MKPFLLFFAVSAFAQQQLHLIPPAGVAVPEADQRALKGGIARLAGRIEAQKANPHIADVEIFLKAVKYGLEGNEFFTAEDIFKAKELLRIGNERMVDLERGDAPWTRATGLVVRGYVSKIDGSVQPYGLVVPASYGPEEAALVACGCVVPWPVGDAERGEFPLGPDS